jgi:hypothetical protein
VFAHELPLGLLEGRREDDVLEGGGHLVEVEVFGR